MCSCPGSSDDWLFTVGPCLVAWVASPWRASGCSDVMQHVAHAPFFQQLHNVNQYGSGLRGSFVLARNFGSHPSYLGQLGPFRRNCYLLQHALLVASICLLSMLGRPALYSMDTQAAGPLRISWVDHSWTCLKYRCSSAGQRAIMIMVLTIIDTGAEAKGVFVLNTRAEHSARQDLVLGQRVRGTHRLERSYVQDQSRNSRHTLEHKHQNMM